MKLNHAARATTQRNPAIQSFERYALVVQGTNENNSLSSADVGQRSLTCLSLDGTVTFPLSYADLTTGAGVSVLISSPSVRFTVLGFSNVTLPLPTTVANLFAGSTGLSAYVLAQETVDLSSKSAIDLTSTYNASSGDIIPSCAPDGGGVSYYKGFSENSAGDTVTFVQNEATVPPRNSNGLSNKETIPNVIGFHSLIPSSFLSSANFMHVAVDTVHNLPPNPNTVQKAIFTVKATAGRVNFNAGACGSAMISIGTVNIGLFIGSTSTWLPGSSIAPDTYEVQTPPFALTPAQMAIGDKILTSIRSTHFGAVENSRCSALSIESSVLRFE